jgi:drug/metabolite transporter (DMT)-like permease
VEVPGIGLGLAGVAALSAPGGLDPVGAGILLGAAAAWAVGSLVNRYADLPDSPARTAATAVLVVLGVAPLVWSRGGLRIDRPVWRRAGEFRDNSVTGWRGAEL